MHPAVRTSTGRRTRGRSPPPSATSPAVTPSRATPKSRSTTSTPWSCADTRWPPPTGGSSRRSPPRPRSRYRQETPRRRRPPPSTTLSEVDKLRTALLSAVSHDLRTPARLGQGRRRRPAQRATSTSAPADRDELLATAAESLDRLTRLVENLLDMSRLQAGALGMSPQPMSIADAIARALDDLGAPGRDVTVHVPDEPPEVLRRPGADRTRPGQPARQRAAATARPTGRR